MKDLYFKVLQHKATVPASVGAASFAVGFASGILYKRYRASVAEYDAQLELDISESEDDSSEDTLDYNEYFSAPKPEELPYHYYVTKDGKVVDRGGNVVEETPEEEEAESEPVAEVVNIFENANGDWDMEAEVAERSEDSPYIIHAEEFFNDELGFAQTTLTYYQGDDILTDDRDVPIYNQSGKVGDLRFGHGSNDPNVVYIRNHKLRAEFEVLLDTGYYEHEVLGIDIAEDLSQKDLRHSAHPPRFRWVD